MFLALWKFGLQLLPWTSYFSTVIVPASCFTSPSVVTVVDLAHCLDAYTVPKEFYTKITYTIAQPTDPQREAWKDAVTNLLSVDNIDCSTVTVPSDLIRIYAIRRFGNYCVLYETTSTRTGVYNKGWGFMIVPSLKSHITRHLHISAPHPKFDDRTVEQAAAVFQLTGSKSLLVAGRHRNAYTAVSDCITPYSLTDPAHNKAEPFFDAIVKIHDWQVALDDCPTTSCAFIQFHGNGGCPDSPLPPLPPIEPVTIFLSAGLDTPPPSPPPNWYTDIVDRPVKRIQANAIHHLPSTWTIKLPSESSCDLTASKNIGGRYINSIPASFVCIRDDDALPASTLGKFVHIEQLAISRDPAYHALWAQVVADSF